MTTHSESPSAKIEKSSAPGAAQSSTRRGPHLIGVLLFAWSWFVAATLLLIFAPPVVLLGTLFNRQNWIYWWAKWGARNWLRLSGVKVIVSGREHLDPNQPYVFVSNHRSYLDAAPLFAFTGRDMGAIAKKELLKAPILGYAMGFVNVIAIDRSNRERAVETIRVATDRLRSEISFMVCPEGTRAQPGEMLPFKKGAFHMAVQAGVPIVPIALKNSDVLMGKGKGEAWPGTIEMVMMPPVETSWVKTDDDLDALVKQVQQLIMRELGVERLSIRVTKTTAPQNRK
ncbi:MAG TPA: lysophospholipid acyltransferase family protein [Pyrinomonadaceae bacterium]|jgi:1-acyl-sn-glycerol-3-phosphate acyltransferase|nr:lysophospholipid acyltransferase family protein [Pyrinomonadaceae bacterium]